MSTEYACHVRDEGLDFYDFNGDELLKSDELESKTR